MRFSLWLTRPLLCLSDFSSLRLIFTFQFLRVACPFLIFLFRLPSYSFSLLSWCLVSCLVLSVSFQFYYAFNSHLGWVGFAVSPMNLLHCLRTFYWWVGELSFALSGFIWKFSFCSHVQFDLILFHIVSQSLQLSNSHPVIVTLGLFWWFQLAKVLVSLLFPSDPTDLLFTFCFVSLSCSSIVFFFLLLFKRRNMTSLTWCIPCRFSSFFPPRFHLLLFFLLCSEYTVETGKLVVRC